MSAFEELLPKANYQGPQGAARCVRAGRPGGERASIAGARSWTSAIAHPPNKDACRYAVDTAKGKVLDVHRSLAGSNPSSAQQQQQQQQPVALIIGADTVVEHDGLILEKPDDAAMAASMLRS